MVRPLGKVQYDSMQVSVNRRMTDGLAITSAYTFAKATDWWAGNILIPEYWHLNKGTQGGNTPHKLDLSAIYELPFGVGKRFANNDGVLAKLAGGWQVNGYFTAFSGTPFSISAQQRVAGREQRPACRPGEAGSRDPRRYRLRQPVLRRHGVQAGHRGAVRHRRVQHPARTRRSQPGPERVPHVRASRAATTCSSGWRSST